MSMGVGMCHVLSVLRRAEAAQHQSPRQPRPGTAKLTAIHRFALATVIQHPTGSNSQPRPPVLLPETIPHLCCYNNFRCLNNIKWQIDDGYFCQKHAELWWQRGHFIQDHRVERVCGEDRVYSARA
jgi:hypothetical protein